MRIFFFAFEGWRFIICKVKNISLVLVFCDTVQSTKCYFERRGTSPSSPPPITWRDAMKDNYWAWLFLWVGQSSVAEKMRNFKMRSAQRKERELNQHMVQQWLQLLMDIITDLRFADNIPHCHFKQVRKYLLDSCIFIRW